MNDLDKIIHTLRKEVIRSFSKALDDAIQKATEEIMTQREIAEESSVPHSKIIDLYHKWLPDSPSVKVWTSARRSLLRARWEERKKRQSLLYWDELFEFISESAFLTGKVMGKDGRPFKPTLCWMLKEENFAKIIEGKYHNE